MRYCRMVSMSTHKNKTSPRGSILPGGGLYRKAATYSPALRCSTIGVPGLNFSVRDGKRWDPGAKATKVFLCVMTGKKKDGESQATRQVHAPRHSLQRSATSSGMDKNFPKPRYRRAGLQSPCTGKADGLLVVLG